MSQPSIEVFHLGKKNVSLIMNGEGGVPVNIAANFDYKEEEATWRSE